MTSQNSRARASAPGGRQSKLARVPYNPTELIVWHVYGLISTTHIFPHFHMPKSPSWLQTGSPASGVITYTEHQNVQKWCQQLGKLPGVAMQPSFKGCYAAKVLMEQIWYCVGKQDIKTEHPSEANERSLVFAGQKEALAQGSGIGTTGTFSQGVFICEGQEVAGSLSYEL